MLVTKMVTLTGGYMQRFLCIVSSPHLFSMNFVKTICTHGSPNILYEINVIPFSANFAKYPGGCTCTCVNTNVHTVHWIVLTAPIVLFVPGIVFGLCISHIIQASWVPPCRRYCYIHLAAQRINTEKFNQWLCHKG